MPADPAERLRPRGSPLVDEQGDQPHAFGSVTDPGSLCGRNVSRCTGHRGPGCRGSWLPTRQSGPERRQIARRERGGNGDKARARTQVAENLL